MGWWRHCFHLRSSLSLLIIGGAIYSFIAARKRREELFELAARLGLNFSPANDHGLADRFSFLDKLAQGSNRYAFNVLSGNYRQNEVLVFDYHYETYSTDSEGQPQTHHHYFSFFILLLPISFPELKITREGLLSKIAQALGYEDIDFESAEFSRTFCVRSKDRKFAYDVCNAQMMDYLLANRDLSIEIEGPALALAFDKRLSAVGDRSRPATAAGDSVAPARLLVYKGLTMLALLILLLVALLPIVWVVVQYNWLVSLRNYINESWSNVDTELKRRYDLIPNLVATVKGYAAHEREVLERVTQLRERCVANNGSPAEQARDETQLVDALKQMLVVVENYPQLKADQQFLKLQQELITTENRIQAARRFYNGNVRDYRNKCETFPSNLVAQMFGFQPQEFFSVPPSVKEVPDVEFALKSA